MLRPPYENTTLPGNGNEKGEGNADTLTVVFGVLATLFAVVNIVLVAYMYDKSSHTPVEDSDVEMQMPSSDAPASSSQSTNDVGSRAGGEVHAPLTKANVAPPPSAYARP